MINENIERVQIGTLYRKVKSTFAKNMGTYIGYYLLTILMSSMLALIVNSLDIPFLQLFNQFFTALLFLGYSVYAFKAEKTKKGNFKHFFGAFPKADGILAYKLIQVLYGVLALIMFFFLILGPNWTSWVKLLNNDVELSQVIVKEIIYLTITLLLFSIPLLIMCMAPQHYINSNSSLKKSLVVSYSIFKKNWVTYILLFLIFIGAIMGSGFLIGMVVTFLGNGILIFILMLPFGLFTFFIVIPMIFLLPYCIYSLAYQLDDRFMDDKLNLFGSNSD